MVNYDPKAWFQITFSVRGTVLPRVAARLVELGVFTALVWGFDEYLAARWGYTVPALNPMAHSLMGIAVGMLIVFRNNCSYDRFWEGRKLWGSIVNTSRNLVRGAAVYRGHCVDLANLVAAYVLVLKQHLRANPDLDEAAALMPGPAFATVKEAANPPSVLAYFLSAWIHEQRGAGKLDQIQERTLETYVAGLVDCQGGCERIQKTPIPFAYACHIKQFLLLYLGTLPFVVVPLMGWVSIPVVVLVTFGLYGIEEVGVEIEDPFGEDPNDLPLDALCQVIARDTLALAMIPGKSS
jgi:putative membrane protein